MSDFPEKDLDRQPEPAEEPRPAAEAGAGGAEEHPADSAPPSALTAAEQAAAGDSTIFTKPDHSGKKPPKKKGSHLVRNVVAALIALCVLAGAVLAVYMFIPKPEEEAGSSSSSMDIQLVSLSTADIARIDLQNQTGSYSIYPTEAAEGMGSGTEGLTWHMDGVTDEYIDAYALSALADGCASVQAQRRIGEDGDLAAYGLDAPRATAVVTGQNEADSYALYVGNDAPTGDGAYIRIGDDPQIYLAGTYLRDIFLRDKVYYTNVNMVQSVARTSGNSSYFDDSGNLRSFDLITISGKDHPETMEFIPNPYAETSLIPYLMRSPVTQNVMGDVFDSVFKILSTGLTADGGFAFYPTPEQLASYGLDNPGTVVNFKVGATDLILRVGTLTEDGYYPVTVNDRQVIYKLETASLSFVELDPAGYFSSVLFMDDIVSVKSLEMKTADSDHVYSFTHGVDQNDAATLEVDCGGKAIVTADFRNFYQYVLRCPASDFTLDAAPAGVEPSLVLTVRYLDDARPALEIRFVRQSDRRYHVTVNGTPLGFAAVNTVDQLIRYDADLYAGKEIPTP
ncbi:MAG: DUF4340 domain-containing protein [Clostridiales bacterium]|nr:DUF4340 domain-containing protein [Clostridiales bacterium]